MTKEGIDYNLSRIEVFLGFNGRLLREVKGMSDIEVLFEGFSRLMDFNGAGKMQYSILLLTIDDFNELKKYASVFDEYFAGEDFTSDNAPHGPSVFSRGEVTFQYVGYKWQLKHINKYPIIEIKY